MDCSRKRPTSTRRVRWRRSRPASGDSLPWLTGGHAYTLADLRAVIGSKTFALYAGLFHTAGGGMGSLFDYLMSHLGSIRVSDRVPAVGE